MGHRVTPSSPSNRPTPKWYAGPSRLRVGSGECSPWRPESAWPRSSPGWSSRWPWCGPCPTWRPWSAAGAAAIAAGRAAGPDDLAWARGVLEAVGTVVTVPETALDAVTGLSGSGPAYVFLVAEALIDAGVLVGLSRPVASQLAVQTLLGSARLLDETGDEPATLRAAVTSPGGTTAAGLRALEAGGVRHAVLEAVVAATERSRELGRPG